MDNERSIPLPAIVSEFVSLLKVKETKAEKKAIKAAILRFCNKPQVVEAVGNLLEKSAVYTPDGTMKQHLFTEDEWEFLMTSQELVFGLIKNRVSDNQKEEIKAAWLEQNENKIEAARARAEQWRFDPVEDGPDDDFFVTDEELRRMKMEIMIEALFLRCFTPIDEDQLRADMREMKMAPWTEITEQTVEARKRLEKNRSKYYKERTADD